MMDSLSIDTQRKRRWIGVVFAILFPSLVTWLYFVGVQRFSPGAQQSVFLIVKVVQFAFPAGWTYFALRERLRTAQPTSSGLALGAAFSVVVVAAGMAVFH